MTTKVKLETRAMGAASGDVAYTGYGFQPGGLLIITDYNFCIGVSEPGETAKCLYRPVATYCSHGAYLVYATVSTGKVQYATLASYDADGFTLTWTKVGAPIGSATLFVFAFK